MKSIKRLFPFLKKYKGYVALNILSNILMVLFSLVSIPIMIPFLTILFGKESDLVKTAPSTLASTDDLINYLQYFFSQVIEQSGREQAMIYVCVSIVATFFFKNLFRYLSLVFMTPIRNGIVRDLRQALFHKTMILPLSYFSEERKGDLISRFTADVQEIESSILSVLEVVIRAPLTIIGSLAFMIAISSSLTLFALALILFTVVIIGGIGKTLRKKSSAIQEQLGSLVSMIEEGISGLKIIKGFNAISYQEQRFDEENTNYKNLLNRLLWRRDLAAPLSEFLGVTTVAVLIWYGYYEVQKGTLVVGTFIAFLYAFFGIIDPAKRFSKASYSIQKGLAAADRVDDILNAEVTIQEPTHSKNFSTFKNEIIFQNVHFSYLNSDKMALNGINLTIKKGEIVALVGNSGGGKSTLVDLLSRFYDVTKGQIKIDGTNIKDYKLGELRSSIGLVTQEAVLFNDSVYQNIVFGLEDISEKQVIAAAKIAHAHEFIVQMENGYDTNIGDRGVKLSGGQRQRLTIARAVLRNPAILVLDEATSALDSESEKLVQAALQNLMQNRTALVIAHRLSTIKDADKIVVLKEGQMIEIGKHEELLSRNGAYKKLVDLQSF